MKEMICICCPMGCRLSVDDSDKNDIKVSGNTCPRGAKYARDEVICPKRMVTSVVEVEGGEIGMVSVKTSDSIPKDRMFDALKLLDNLLIPAPVKLGQVIVENDKTGFLSAKTICYFDSAVYNQNAIDMLFGRNAQKSGRCCLPVATAPRTP